MDKRERFWQKVQPGADDECWPWLGATNRQGYGRLRTGSRESSVTEMAHRLAYQFTFGAIPDGKHVCHHCDNPPCCNPKHLYAGTQLQNVRDRDERNRNGKAKLNPESVRLIRLAWADGWTLERIAAYFGIDQTTARGAALGLSWRHVK